jgi:endoglucanase
MIPHTGLRDLVVDVAEREGIPFQFDKVAGGGTDAGKMHVFGAGVPSLVIGVPVRYIHTHAAIMHRDDFDNAAKLLVAVVKRLDVEIVQQLKS